MTQLKVEDFFVVFGDLGPEAVGKTEDSLSDAELEENWRWVQTLLDFLADNGAVLRQRVGSQFTACFAEPEVLIRVLLACRTRTESLADPAGSALPARIAVNFGAVKYTDADPIARGDAAGAAAGFHGRCMRPGLFFTQRAFERLPDSLKLGLRRSAMEFDPPLKKDELFIRLIGSELVYEL